MVTQLSHMGMSTADALMAGRVGAVDLAAVSIGSNVYWPIMLLMSGTLLAVTPTISQLRGAGQVPETGAVVRQAAWIALVGAMLGVAIMWNARFVFEWIGVDATVAPVASEFLRAQSLGLFGMLGYFLLRYLCEGMAWVRPAMLVSLSALGIKVCLNYILVFGAWGNEPLGGVGCGVSTALVVSYQFLALGLIVRFSHMRRTGVFDRFNLPDFGMLRKLLTLGIPIGLSIFCEVAFFSGVGLLIGRLGAEAIAGHQIAIIVGGVAFMIPLALGQATTIRVGAFVGGRRLDRARNAARVSLLTAAAIACASAVTLILGRHFIAGLFSSDAGLIEVAATLLIMCGMFQVFDAINIVAMGALRGYKDTRLPMLLSVFAYWLVGMPLGAYLAFGGPGIDGLGVIGFWIGLVIGLVTGSLLVSFRLYLISGNPERVLSKAEPQQERAPEWHESRTEQDSPPLKDLAPGRRRAQSQTDSIQT